MKEFLTFYPLSLLKRKEKKMSVSNVDLEMHSHFNPSEPTESTFSGLQFTRYFQGL